MRNLLTCLCLGMALSSASFAQTSELPDFETAIKDKQNWREVAAEDLIVMKVQSADGLARGLIYIETADFMSPNHTAQFKKIVRSGDYNGTIFHRVMDDFMAQGGDVKRYKPASEWPNIDQEFVFTRKPGEKDGAVPPAYLLGKDKGGLEGYIKGFPIKTQSEFLASYTEAKTVESWMLHCPGTVSTARTDDPNSASTQFFMMRYTSTDLDKRYTPWGRVVAGQDVVMSIEKGDPETGAVDRPDILVSAKIAEDIDEDKRPRVLVQKMDGPLFQKTFSEAEQMSVCALPPVPAILKE